MSARCHWEERRVTSKTGTTWRKPEAEDEEDGDSSSQDDDEDETDSAANLRRRSKTGASDDEHLAGEVWPIRRLYKGLHLTLNLESASLLPVVLR